ncbi:hypothetical protein Cgig2_031102 [Carnegiea gigantea]|uniref:Uncharacterized protein n=1 Tax=Carnegiea gigantea TaxID=171969 RepID=A0A9Q1JN52_9CARY|nr:hypothetical protein Cgig2_031102 [Carnegiea gigantea]
MTNTITRQVSEQVQRAMEIDCFLKKGPCFLRGEREPTQPQPQDKECSTEVVATIARGYPEGMTWSAWKAQLRGAQQVLTTEQGARMTVPTMVFGKREAPRFASPHSDPFMVEMKIVSAIARRILIDTESSVDIITWDCLKKLTYPGRVIVALVHPILGFRGQELKKRVLHIGPSTILTALIFRSPDLSIQGVGHLVPWAITLTGRGDKLHLLRVPTLGLGLLAFMDIMEILLLGLPSIFLLLQLLPAPLVPGHQPLQPSALRCGLYASSKSLSHSHLFLGDLVGLRSARRSQVPGLN